MQLTVTEWMGLIHRKCHLILLKRSINFTREKIMTPRAGFLISLRYSFCENLPTCARDN